MSEPENRVQRFEAIEKRPDQVQRNRGRALRGSIGHRATIERLEAAR